MYECRNYVEYLTTRETITTALTAIVFSRCPKPRRRIVRRSGTNAVKYAQPDVNVDRVVIVVGRTRRRVPPVSSRRHFSYGSCSPVARYARFIQFEHVFRRTRYRANRYCDIVPCLIIRPSSRPE